MRPRSPLRDIPLLGVIGSLLWLAAAPCWAQNFIANPNNLGFNVQVNSLAAPQTFSLTSSGANMSFTISTSVASPAGGNWLFAVAVANNFTTPATISVSVNVLGLAPTGTDYTGSVTIRATGGNNAMLVIPITLNVFGDLGMVVDPEVVTFITAPGTNPPVQELNVIAVGGHSGPLNFTTAIATQSGGNWLSVNPVSSSTPRTMTLSAQAGNLPAGDYSATITLTDTANRTLLVQVFLILRATPTISLSSAELTFFTAAGGSPPAQSVQVTNSGAGALNWSAAPATQSGGNWLSVSPGAGTAPASLTVSVNSVSLTRGVYTGSITISSPNATNSPRLIPVSLAVDAPVVNNNGVINGASFSTEAVVSSSSIASLFGLGLAQGVAVATALPLPTSLGGTQVFVNDTPAPLFFVSPNQINFQILAGLSGSTARVAVALNGLRGPESTIQLAPAVPGIFTTLQNGTGQGAVLNQDFSPNSPQNPEARGRVLQIYVTGLGATNPPLGSGQPGASSEPLNRTTATPIVLIGGISAAVSFSAMAPGFVGLYQVNATVPNNVAPGNAVTLQIQIGGRSSNSVTVAIN